MRVWAEGHLLGTATLVIIIAHMEKNGPDGLQTFSCAVLCLQRQDYGLGPDGKLPFLVDWKHPVFFQSLKAARSYVVSKMQMVPEKDFIVCKICNYTMSKSMLVSATPGDDDEV